MNTSTIVNCLHIVLLGHISVSLGCTKGGNAIVLTYRDENSHT